MKLSVGKSAVVTVNPAERYQATGLAVSKGERYAFEASGKWADASRICGPDGWRDWWTPPLLGFTRLPGSDFFVLGGNIARREKSNFRIGSSALVTIETDGDLSLFANDLWFLYCNNHALPDDPDGPLQVSIIRKD